MSHWELLLNFLSIAMEFWYETTKPQPSLLLAYWKMILAGVKIRHFCQSKRIDIFLYAKTYIVGTKYVLVEKYKSIDLDTPYL